MALIRMNRNTKTVVKALALFGGLWLIVSIFFIKSSSEDSRPPQLRRWTNATFRKMNPRSDLEQFKPVQPSKKFEFPQMPILQKPLERVVGFFHMSEPDRNIIPPPLHIQLRKPTRNPNAPGELGKAVNINKDDLSPEERKKYDDGFQNNAFNEYASNLISIHRQLPDVRDPECKIMSYAKNLPDTSVIICFHNEAWSVLLRSVHSVIDRSDPKLLKQVILVDDFSDKPHLGEQLQKYMDELKIVTIVRMQKREGLIRARLAGAKAATGGVLTFLDSHIECAEGWLEPLLDEILKDKTNVVTPVIDVIDDSTLEFHYGSAKHTSVGGFDWNLQFNWHSIPDRENARRKGEVDPIHSPTMAGGLFSISREYFVELGTYDAGMDFWGGENLEMSFRIWMCGGTLEILPCSHVGHIFREKMPYKWKEGDNVVRKNSIRLAEVWMDDYKHYYYDRINNDLGNFGDISSRVSLRKNLNCKSFDWYIRTIYPELFIPDDAIYTGDIRNKASPHCVDSPADHHSYNKAVKMWPCHNQGGNQYWLMSAVGEIRRDEACIDYTGSGTVNMYMCHGQGGNQKWVYKENGLLEHAISGKCMEASPNGDGLLMNACNSDNSKQVWEWKRGKGKKH